ncbi:glutamate--tRNA ligase [Spiroplasma endosymbiont of Crioceris asparagi]|uniref:glutamate--tRNA ligase n=1 Tax=Spiroplasma endosymbiont of Crioceris asparagi TaxID=3066286 RepID=UPI0030CB6CEB
MKNIRLRYAPSPTGYLHIGNTRTALMNFLFAKNKNGSFIVRIEDTDFDRNVEGAIESQFDNLKWLSIIPDESLFNPNKKYGKYKQSEKLDDYQQIAEILINKKMAYKCFCTEVELEEQKELQKAKGIVATRYIGSCYKLTTEEIQKNLNENKSYSIRFKVPENKEYKINDLVRGEIKFNSSDIGDFVIVKSNGVATYNFAVVVDDYDMKISHVIRGEEHISNTPKQLMIYDVMGWEVPVFAHMTLIVDENKKKLSKRSNNQAFFISQYKKDGYLPEAIFNYIALLGWSPSVNQEIFSNQELIKVFDEKRFSKSPSTFDIKKLQWINKQWIKKMDDLEYLKFIKNFVDYKKFDFSNYNDEKINIMLLAFKREIDYGIQINNLIEIFFNDSKITNENKTLLETFNYKEISNLLINKFMYSNKYDEENIKLIINEISAELNIKGKNLFMPIRLLTSHEQHGPELAKVIYILGKEKVINNIKTIIGV